MRPELIRFRYRLEGLEPDWVEAGTRRSAFYSYLPPGSYRFHVAACNNNGVWSEKRVEPAPGDSRHFWQTWWFITLAVVGARGRVIITVHVTEKKEASRPSQRLEQERAWNMNAHESPKICMMRGGKLCRISFL